VVVVGCIVDVVVLDDVVVVGFIVVVVVLVDVVVVGSVVVEVLVEVDVEVVLVLLDVEVVVLVDVVVGGSVVVVVVLVEVVVGGSVVVVDVLVDVDVEVVVLVDVEVEVLVDVEVEVLLDVVVVSAGESGSCIVRNAWSPVFCALFVDTRIWQSVQSCKPLIGPIGASFGDRQLNNVDGLSPLNGVNANLVPAAKVTFPFSSETLPGVVRPLSQSRFTLQPGAVDNLPSHCSTYTGVFGGNPSATIVNATGLPAPSPGTTNGSGPGAGDVIAAYPTPPNTNTQANVSKTPIATRRDRPSIANPLPLWTRSSCAAYSTARSVHAATTSRGSSRCVLRTFT
jgi:hypothetical protein